MDKRIELDCAKIVSLSKGGKWSQSFSLENLYCVLEISGSIGFETSLLGKQLIEETQRRYLSEENKNLEFIKTLISFFKEKSTPEISLNVALCLENGLILYLGTLNQARILMKRENKLAVILKGEKDAETASGFLKDQDKIFLETESFAKVISDQKLMAAVDNRNAQEVADILAPEVQAQEEFSGVGMVIDVKVIPEEIGFAPESETLLVHEEEGASLPPKPLPEKEITGKITGPDEVISVKKKTIFNKAKNFLRNKLFWVKGKIFLFLSSRPIYIRHQPLEDDKKRKLTINIAVILLILLFVSVTFSLKKNLLSKTEVKFNEAYSMAVKKQEEGRALIDLNPVRSKTLLEESKKTLEEVKALVEKNKKLKSKLEKLADEIDSELEIVAKVYRLKELPLFFDLTLIKDKAEGKALALTGENLFIYDSFNNSIYFVNIKNKSQETLTGGKELENGVSLTSLGEKTFFLTNNGVYQIKNTDESKIKVISVDKNKEEIKQIYSFGSNLYLLDIKKNRIWKYGVSDSGLSEIKNYLAEGINPDFSKAVSFTIDGAIFVLKSDGEVIKFIQGNPEGFKISGLDLNLNQPTKIFTSEDLKNIYLLDPKNKKIVVIDKKGQYQSQYVNEEIKKAADLVVSKDEKKIYLVVESKIYEIEVK